MLLDNMHYVKNYRRYIDNIQKEIPLIDISKCNIEEKKFIYSAMYTIINKSSVLEKIIPPN